MLRTLITRPQLITFCVGFALLSQIIATCASQEVLTELADVSSTPQRLTLKIRTLGGRQFWADELVFHDWRIQRNTNTDHYRLLDENNRRQAWGTFEQCQARLKEIKHDRDLKPMHGKVVIMLHGLFRTRTSTNGIGKYLNEHGDYTVLQVGYPTTRADIGQHAKGLARVIENLDGDIEEINFVAHSLGNLVLRHYLQDLANAGRSDDRFGRIVMLGPPNQGAQLAKIFSNLRFYDWVVKGTGEQLASDFVELNKNLATPIQPFGIIAGGKGDDAGYNRFIDGDDDLVVRVEEAKLPGASDFVLIPVRHTFMMGHEIVQEHTLRFLQYGHFVSAEERHPLPRVVEAP